MKSFRQYLTESAREYNFIIKLASKPESDLEDRIENAMKRYGLLSMSHAKSEPVRIENNAFPLLSNPEVYSIEVQCEYPVTSELLRNAVHELGVPLGLVSVFNKDHADDMSREEKAIQDHGSKGGSALLRDLETVKIKDPVYGSDYNSKLVKNSVTKAGGKVAGAPGKAQTTNELPQGKKSAMGSTPVKKPVPKSFAR